MTGHEPRRARTQLRPDDIVARAVALRQHLRDDQAKTEARSRYSEETNVPFTQAGFYRMLQPRMFGGYEFEQPEDLLPHDHRDRPRLPL